MTRTPPLIPLIYLWLLAAFTFYFEAIDLNNFRHADRNGAVLHNRPDRQLASLDQDGARTDFCAENSSDDKVVLDQIEIYNSHHDSLSSNVTSPKVLCFIPMTSDNVEKAREVLQTWGKRCDKLVFASNATEEHLPEATQITIPTDNFEHLWLKLRQTVRHIWHEYGDEYEWFLKADLDTYIIMENLKLYLSSDEIQSKKGEPLILSRRLSLPKWAKLHYSYNKTLEREFNAIYHDKFLFTSGGAGYVMNKNYMRKFYDSMDEYFCCSNPQDWTVPEDVALNFCMAHLGVYPSDTRDELERERFHPLPPSKMFKYKKEVNQWMVPYHKHTDGMKWGEDCCSTSSVSFHGLKKPGELRKIESILYTCRNEEIETQK